MTKARSWWGRTGARIVVVTMVLCPAAACGRPSTPAINLIDRFPTAVEVRPGPSTFSIGDVTIAGRRERSIAAAGSSRLVMEVTIPKQGELHVALGIPEDAATAPKGVLFRVLVATEGSPGPDVLFSRQLNPAANAADRGWQDVVVNLLPFAGETVSLFFNTNADVKGVWGSPYIYGQK